MSFSLASHVRLGMSELVNKRDQHPNFKDGLVIALPLYKLARRSREHRYVCHCTCTFLSVRPFGKSECLIPSLSGEWGVVVVSQVDADGETGLGNIVGPRFLDSIRTF